MTDPQQPGDPHTRPGNHPKEPAVTYTHVDVELVARALHDLPGDTPFDYYDDAKRALDALAAAGRLRTATQHVESSVEDWDGPIPASMARRVDFSTSPEPEARPVVARYQPTAAAPADIQDIALPGLETEMSLPHREYAAELAAELTDEVNSDVVQEFLEAKGVGYDHTDVAEIEALVERAQTLASEVAQHHRALRDRIRPKAQP